MRGLLFTMFVLGCGSQQGLVVADAEEFGTEAGPLLGANGRDAAERGCNVILRTAQRNPTSVGYESTWLATVDVSAQSVAEGATPFMLYKAFAAPEWTRVAGSQGTGAPTGFVRYVYRLETNTVTDTSAPGAGLELSPYLRTTSGARLFDHNRRPGDFDTYVLSAASGWNLKDDATVCRARSRDQRSADVAVTRVSSAPTVCFFYKPEGHTCTGQVLDLKRCTLTEHQSAGATFDCTKAYEELAGVRLMRALVVDALKITGPEQESNGDYWVRTAFHMKRVELAVREAAMSAASFTGVGFYYDAVTYRYYLPVPAPRPAIEFPFLTPPTLRPTAERVTLKDGSAAIVTEVALAIQAAEGGSSTTYGAWLRPYAEFTAGGEIFRNYDLVERDYFVNYSTTFDRRSDVLR